MTSQFSSDDIANYKRYNEVVVSEFFNNEYLKRMEDLETELLALDLLLEKKATSDSKRSDFRKNVTMKSGRGLRKMLGFSEGRRETLEKKIKRKEEEWIAMAKIYHKNSDNSNIIGKKWRDDPKFRDAIEAFNLERFKKKSIVHTIDSTRKMKRKERESYKYDTRFLEPALTPHGSEDNMSVSLGGRRRKRTRKRRRKKRRKKRTKKRGKRARRK